MPILGEIRVFAGWQEPEGWRRCDGQLIEVNRNRDLFDAIGTRYGGTVKFVEGTWDYTDDSTFALPNIPDQMIPMQPDEQDYYNNGMRYFICTVGDKPKNWDGSWSSHFADGLVNPYAW